MVIHKKYKAISLACSVIALGMNTQAYADSHDAEERASIDDIQRQMQATFQNLTINHFKEAPIPGVFEADIGGRVIYYVPDGPKGKLLIFGQVFDANGVDLTGLSMQDRARKKLGNLDLSVAVNIGPNEGPQIVEFTNPDCPYCKSLDNFFEGQAAAGQPVNRQIIFTVKSEQSIKKAVHVLCAEDKEKAMKEVFRGGASIEWQECVQGRSILEEHTRMSSAAGVNGTPTLFLDGKPVTGFRQNEILAFLEQKKDEQ